MIEIKDSLIFWSGVMRDHAKFQLDGLAPSEIGYIQHSMYFMNFFESIRKRLEGCEDWKNVHGELYQGLLCFINHKQNLLRGLLTCQVKLNLPPSLINHQLNEANEFRGILEMPSRVEIKNNLAFVQYVKIWITDAIGHAAGIATFLDPSEMILREEAKRYETMFNQLQSKAGELEMMIAKTGVKESISMQLAEEFIDLLMKFNVYLGKVCALRKNCKVLGFGTLSPLIPDHFIREHEYFIAQVKKYMNKDMKC